MTKQERLELEKLSEKDFQKIGTGLFDVFKDAKNYRDNKSSMSSERKEDVIYKMLENINQVMYRVKQINEYVKDTNTLYRLETEILRNPKE